MTRRSMLKLAAAAGACAMLPIAAIRLPRLRREPAWLRKLKRDGAIPISEIPGHLTLEDVADICLAEGKAVHLDLGSAPKREVLHSGRLEEQAFTMDWSVSTT